jgi:hypothetical protein
MPEPFGNKSSGMLRNRSLYWMKKNAVQPLLDCSSADAAAIEIERKREKETDEAV